MLTASKLSKYTLPGLLVLSLFIAACTSPYNRVGFQGRLTDASGIPLNGSYNIGFRYITCESGAPGSLGCSAVYTQTATSTTVTGGVFDMAIGAETLPSLGGPDPAIYAQPLWVEVTVNGEVMAPRVPLRGSPYAMSLIGGAVIGSSHTTGGSTPVSVDYGSLTVSSSGSGGTALVIANAGSGDYIRACVGASASSRACSDLKFRVQNNGNVTADGSFTGGGADVAELVKPVGPVSNYEAGDVLAVSPTRDRAVELASEPYSTAVLGVFATKPGMILGGDLLDVHGEGSLLPVAFVGIVPVKVTAENGPIRRGDLLTTSSTPGFAMLADEYVPGAMLGKAMGQLRSGTGVIEVALIVR
jgi:hypothetical protein